jgi:hypothetical protein
VTTEATTERKAPEKGEVREEMVVVDGFPIAQRAAGGNRSSAIETALDQIRVEHAPGTVLRIKSYSKQESATGTLYNLRKRHGKPGEQDWDGWLFRVVKNPEDDLYGLYVSFKPEDLNGQ